MSATIMARLMASEEKKEKEVLIEEGIASDIPEAVVEVEHPSEEIVVEAPTDEAKKFEKRKDFKKGERRYKETEKPAWIPKTQLGKDIVAGKYTSLKQVLESGQLILEPGIVDFLVPNLKQEIIYIGGTPGKGGGIKRTATRITARMHKSGRRYNSSSIVVVGNEDGVVGLGKGASKEHRQAIEKSVDHAKLNVIKVKRGCGSWECNCKTEHSVPFRVSGKYGSVRVTLNPAPKGVGIVADKESKKILYLAGIKDLWMSSEGQTSTRSNLSFAVFTALRNLSRVKGDL